MPARIHSSSPPSLQTVMLSNIKGKLYFTNIENCLKESTLLEVPPRCSAALMNQILTVVQQELASLQFKNVTVIMTCIQHFAKHCGNQQGLAVLMKNGLIETIEYALEEVLKSISSSCRSHPHNEAADNLLDASLETLIDIADHDNTYKHEIVEKFIEPLVTLVVNTSKNFHSRMEALRSINLLIEGCSADFIYSFQSKESKEKMLFVLGNLVLSAGDFEMQVACTETLARLIKKSERSSLSKSLFPIDDIGLGFVNIRDAKFETDCRYFLNLVNSRAPLQQSVFSLPCLEVYLGKQKLNPPKDEDLTEFWIDFNTVSHCITMYVQEEDDMASLWETVTISQEVVEDCSIQTSPNAQQLNLQLKCPVSDLLAFCNDVSTVVLIAFPTSSEIRQPLERSIGRMTDQISVKSSDSKFNVRVSKFSEDAAVTHAIQTANFPNHGLLTCHSNQRGHLQQMNKAEGTPSRVKVSIPSEPMKTPCHYKTEKQPMTPQAMIQQEPQQKTPSHRQAPKRVKTPLNITVNGKIPDVSAQENVAENKDKGGCKAPRKSSVGKAETGGSRGNHANKSMGASGGCTVENEKPGSKGTLSAESSIQVDQGPVKVNKQLQDVNGISMNDQYNDEEANLANISTKSNLHFLRDENEFQAGSLTKLKKKIEESVSSGIKIHNSFSSELPSSADTTSRKSPPSKNDKLDLNSQTQCMCQMESNTMVDQASSGDVIEETQFPISQTSTQDFQSSQLVCTEETPQTETSGSSSKQSKQKKSRKKTTKPATEPKRKSPRIAALHCPDALNPKEGVKKRPSGRFHLYSGSSSLLKSHIEDSDSKHMSDDLVPSSCPSQDSTSEFVNESSSSHRFGQSRKRCSGTVSPLLSDIPEGSAEISSSLNLEKGSTRRSRKSKELSGQKSDVLSEEPTRRTNYNEEGKKNVSSSVKFSSSKKSKKKKPQKTSAQKNKSGSLDLCDSAPDRSDDNTDPYEFKDYSENESQTNKKSNKRGRQVRQQSKRGYKSKSADKKRALSKTRDVKDNKEKTAVESLDLSMSIEKWKGSSGKNKHDNFMMKKSFMSFPTKTLTSDTTALQNMNEKNKTLAGGDSCKKQKANQSSKRGGVREVTRKRRKGETNKNADDVEVSVYGDDSHADDLLINFKGSLVNEDQSHVLPDGSPLDAIGCNKLRSRCTVTAIISQNEEICLYESGSPEKKRIPMGKMHGIAADNTEAKCPLGEKQKTHDPVSQNKSKQARQVSNIVKEKNFVNAAFANLEEDLSDIETERETYKPKFDDLGEFQDDDVEEFVSSVLKSLPKKRILTSTKVVNINGGRKGEARGKVLTHAPPRKESKSHLGESELQGQPKQKNCEDDIELLDVECIEGKNVDERDLNSDAGNSIINEELKLLSLKLKSLGKKKQKEFVSRQRNISGDSKQLNQLKPSKNKSDVRKEKYLDPEIEDKETNEVIQSEDFNVEEDRVTIVSVESFASVCQDILNRSGEGIAKTRSRRNIPAVNYLENERSYSESEFTQENEKVDEEEEDGWDSTSFVSSKQSRKSDASSELSWLASAQRKKQKVTTYSRGHKLGWTSVNPQMQKDVFRTTKKTEKRQRVQESEQGQPVAPLKKKRTPKEYTDKEDEAREQLYFSNQACDKLSSNRSGFNLHMIISNEKNDNLDFTPGCYQGADYSEDGEDSIEHPRDAPSTPAHTAESIPSQSSLKTHSSGIKTPKLQVSFDEDLILEPDISLEVTAPNPSQDSILKSGPSKLERMKHSSLKRKYENILAAMDDEEEEQTKRLIVPRKLFADKTSERGSNESSFDISQGVEDEPVSSWEYESASFPMTEFMAIMGQNLKNKMTMKKNHTELLTETAVRSLQQNINKMLTKQSTTSRRVFREFREKLLTEVLELESDIESLTKLKGESRTLLQQKAKGINSLNAHMQKLREMSKNKSKAHTQMEEVLGREMRKSILQTIQQQMTNLKTKLLRDMQHQEMVQVQQAFQSFLLD